jgi:signal transduction histidine kinase
MLQVVMSRWIDSVLYRLREPIAAVALLFILYCNVYMWFYVPPDDYEFTWSPDTQLRILSVPESSLARPYLQPGDRLVAIGDRPVRRMELLYPLPLQPAYSYTVERNGEILTHSIPVPAGLTALAIKNQLPTTLLSLAGWVVGVLLLLFARRANVQAVHAGYTFLLAPVVLVGLQAAQDGAPYAWLGGQALIFFLAVGWPYLGLIPREQPLKPLTRRVFTLSLGAATGLALVAVYEILFLFPRGLSVEELSGISVYSSGFLLSGLGLVAFVLLLGWRACALPKSSYLKQQLLILLVFVAIGVFPIVFLTILPGVLLNTIFLPFPVAIALMIFIPAGYLFVIYRRGFLGLDPFFSRSIYLALLSLVAFGFYASGLYFVQRMLNLGGPEAVLPATVVFFPTLLLAIYLNQPINSFVQQLVYGKAALNQDVLARYALALSSKPELETLDRIFTSLANSLDISCAVLTLRDRSGRFVQISAQGIQGADTISEESLRGLDRPVVRATLARGETLPVLDIFQWAELAVPLRAREEQIGVLALSRPGSDGYFNARQVSFVTQAASILVVASENITLFEATRDLSMRAQMVQEKERQKLALEIHDVPLQEITFVTNTIDHLLFKMDNESVVNGNGTMEKVAKTLSEANVHLRAAAMALRDICIGLYPPFRDQGIQVTVQAITREYEEKHGLHIDLELEHHLHRTPPRENEATTITVGRVLAEALNNVAKHAPGASVSVRLHADEESIYLSIADNGPGIGATSLSLSELVRRKHLGIVGMHESARFAGGSLRVENNEPHGTRVMLICPLVPQDLRLPDSNITDHSR